MFSPDHFIWMGISAIICVILILISNKFKFSLETATKIIFGIFVASEIFRIGTHVFPASKWLGEGKTIGGYAEASYFLPKSLPFQLCSSMIFFLLYLVVSKNEQGKAFVLSFVTEVFLIAAPLAIIFGTCLSSDNTAHLFDSFKDPSLSPYQFFFYHGAMIWYGYYVLKLKKASLGFKPWLKNLFTLILLLVAAVWINSLTLQYETNFMFVVYPPAKGIPLLNLNHGWVVYMIHYILLMAVLTFLFHLPAIIKERKFKTNNSHIETEKGAC